MMAASYLLRVVTSLNRQRKIAVMLTVDSAVLVVALYVTFLVLFSNRLGPGLFLEALPRLVPLVAFGILLSLALGVGRTRLRDVFEAPAVRQTALHCIGVAVAGGMLYSDLLPLGGMFALAAIVFLLAFLARVAMYELLTAIYRNGAPVTRVVVYGAGTTGIQLVAALQQHDSIQPVAFVDDNPALHGLKIAGQRVFAPARLPDLMRDKDVRRVILAMPSEPLPKRQLLARRLSALGLEVQTVPSFAQLIGAEATVDRLEHVGPRSFLTREHVACDPAEVEAIYRGKAVLVSGAGGSIGSELSRQILGYGPRRLVLFEVSEHALFRIDRELRAVFQDSGTEIVPVLGSVTDARLVRAVLRRHAVQIVLHAAAYKHVPLVEQNVVAGLANNVLGTSALAREAAAAGCERFILISSDKAVRPANVMGASKRLAEMVVQDIAARTPATRFAAVRFGNVLGSSGSVVPIFREQIASGGPVTITDDEATRYFMTIEEAVHLVLVAGAVAAGGEIFVLDMGEPVRIRDLARRMIQAAGYSVRDAETPDGDIEIRVIGLRPGERVHEPPMTAGATPTGVHPAILKVEPPRLSEFELATVVRAILTAVSAGEDTDIAEVLRRYVHDYAPGDRAASGERAAEPRRPAAPAVSAARTPAGP